MKTVVRRCSNVSGFKPQPYTNASFEKIKTIRKTIISPAVFHYYKEPLLIHQGHKQWLFDHNNRRYLDLFGGIVTVCLGHCHPRTNEALQRQSNKLWHTTNIYMSPEYHEFADMLVAKLPHPLKVVYLVNSGSEANDLAFLMAKVYTGRHEIVTLRNSYHGTSCFTGGATSLSDWRYSAVTHQGFVSTMNPDPFRGPWGGSNCRDSPVQTFRKCTCAPGQCEASTKYVDQLEDVLRHCTSCTGIAGFIAESIQGVGGTVQFPRDFLAKAFQIVRQRGGLCISDEVQTGFGRLGDHFWGFQGHGVLPDIVTMAKGIANGFPMGAVVTSEKIAASLTTATTFNTFGGNPMGCAVAKEVLRVIDEESLQANCKEVGTYFLLKLKGLLEKHDIVGDVRGKGLMIGVEMVESKSNNAPISADRMSRIFEGLREKGVLVGRGGVYKNVFRIKPPMCITKEDVDFAVDAFDKCFTSS